ncbi:MAG: hypothetical protein CMF96_03625 [Candidatus Marinimicrobia bacterium]|nr:hypothetical protein [Candidatus Neomarinimicrobiota bacterium]
MSEKNKIINSIENYEISYWDIYFILKRHLKLICFSTVLILFLSVIYTLRLAPVYSSTGVILIEDPSSRVNIFDMGVGSDKNLLENEIEILNSHTTAESVVNRLLNSNHKDNLYFFGTRKYTPVGLSKLLDSFFSINGEEYEKNEFLISDSLVNQLTLDLQQNISVNSQRNTDVLKISITSIDPNEAALLVNTLIDEYKNIDLKWANGEMSHLKSFLLEQIEKKEIELTEFENSLKQYQEKEKIFGMSEMSNLLLNNLINSESQLYKSKAEYNILQERINYIKNLLTDEEKLLSEKVINTINERLFTLKNEIAIKEAELVSTIVQQGENHNIVQVLTEKLDRLKLNLQKETRVLISQGISVADPIKYRQSLMDSVISITAVSAVYESKIKEFDNLVENYELQLGELPEKVLKYTRLERNLNIHAETYSLMRQKLEEARINEASKVGKVRIIDKARPDYNRIKPKNKVNVLIGLMLGLGVGIGISFLLEYADNTIKSIDEIDKRGLSILALIPSIGKKINNKREHSKNLSKKIGNIEKIQRRLITHEDPKSPISEAYRSLRTSLMYSKESLNHAKIILVSSPGPGEGKTTTIMNLAITFANLGKKTLLVDCDLRKPVTHKIFNVEKDIGITNFLVGNISNVDKIINPTEIENLSIITSGIIPPNPSEILASENMEILIKKIKMDYDVILIDSPPLLAVTDTFILSKFASQFILVVRAGKTEKGGLDRSLDQMNQVNVNLFGIVMNDVDESNSYGKGYYYNYYQYYYGDS